MASETEVLAVFAACRDEYIADIFDDEQQAREADADRGGEHEVQPRDLRFRPQGRRFAAVSFDTYLDVAFSPKHALMPLPPFGLRRDGSDFDGFIQVEFRERRDWRTREAAMAYVAAKNRKLMAQEHDDGIPEWWAVVEISLPIETPTMLFSMNGKVGIASFAAKYGCRLVTPTTDEIVRLAGGQPDYLRVLKPEE